MCVRVIAKEHTHMVRRGKQDVRRDEMRLTLAIKDSMPSDPDLSSLRTGSPYPQER